MDFATIVGIIAGTSLVISAIVMGGSPMIFFNMQAFMITVGGTVAATFISFNIQQVFNVVRVLGRVFHKEDHMAEKVIDSVVMFAEKARINGILALENDAETAPDPFLRMGLELVVDGTDPALVREILETEVLAVKERHRIGRAIFESMGLYAPSFGMVGTLIGLVQMLLNLQDASKIGPGLAVAIITTFYGVFSAYLIFYPIAKKLDVRSRQEILLKQLIIEGLLAIQAGNNPRLIAKRLKAFLAPRDQANIEENIEKRRQESFAGG